MTDSALAPTALVYHLARSDWPALALIGACALAIGAGRASFVRTRHA